MEPLQSQLPTELLLFVISLLFCALFSFLETSITALRLFHLQQLLKTEKRYESLLLMLEKDPQKILITILIANNIVNVTAAALMTNIIESLFVGLNFSRGVGFSFGIAIATACLLIIGEVIPKNVAQAHGERFFKSTLWFINLAYKVLNPLVWVLSSLSEFIVKKIKPDDVEENNTAISEKEIQFLIDYTSKKGLIETEKTQMLHSIFDLANTTVKEIMVPETDIVRLNVSTSMQDALLMFAKYHFSRLPVYEDTSDNIIGLLHQKDIFLIISASKENKPIKELIRPIMFVPEAMKVNQLLRQLKQQKYHISMVLNEYGGIVGLVTLEDAIEEIVGEINDEHEAHSEEIAVQDGQGGLLVYANIELEKLENMMGIAFEVEGSATLGGFLIEKFQYLPKQNEKIIYKNHTLEIKRATPKRIIQVLISKNE